MLPFIKPCNGNPEKLYLQFCKVFSSTENLYKNLRRNCSLLNSFQVANHVLAHLTGAAILDDVLTYNNNKVGIFQKRIYHQYLTLAAMFLGHFTEISVFPQTILSCIASNVCHL